MNEDNSTKPEGSGAYPMARRTNWMFHSLDKKIYAYGI